MAVPQLVVGAILVDDLAAPSTVLAARRCRPATMAGRWEFPGGKVEPGEQPLQALEREMVEELDVGLELGAEFCRPGGNAWPIAPGWELRLWFAQAVGEPQPGVAHDRLRWLDADELHEVDWLDTDREVIALLEPLLVHGGVARSAR